MLSNKWSEKEKAIPVELGQVYRNENLKEIYYVFKPETTGKYVAKRKDQLFMMKIGKKSNVTDAAAVQMGWGKLITLQWKPDIEYPKICGKRTGSNSGTGGKNIYSVSRRREIC